jgi:hypothetical protein
MGTAAGAGTREGCVPTLRLPPRAADDTVYPSRERTSGRVFVAATADIVFAE